MKKRKPNKRPIDPPQPNRERILMEIIRRLSSTQLMRGSALYSTESFFDGLGGGLRTHFDYWNNPKPGDLVLASSPRISRWSVGWYVEALPGDFGGAVIRELDGDRLCNYTNEAFYPIVGLDQITLLEGDKREFYLKLMSAFTRADEYCYRFGGLRFDGEEAVVSIRSHAAFSKDTTPFEVRIKWSRRMSIAAILKLLREGGLGTKSFRPDPTPNQAATDQSPITLDSP